MSDVITGHIYVHWCSHSCLLNIWEMYSNTTTTQIHIIIPLKKQSSALFHIQGQEFISLSLSQKNVVIELEIEILLKKCICQEHELVDNSLRKPSQTFF